MKKYFFYWLVLCVVFVMGCQKELSFEGSNEPAQGSLQADISGDCLPKSVNGVYEATKPLIADSNTITISVNVAVIGTYIITTDTVNGYFFRATGIFTTPGINTVTLRGNGTPFASGTNNFVVTFDSTVCDVQVTVLLAGAGGPAEFTLVNGGTPANCASAVVNGTYIKDAAVTAINSVDITVDVTKIGTYAITATGGGLTFSKTAAFLTTGQQTVNIPAIGTATTVGANTITFDAPFASCSFDVNVIAGAGFSFDCTTAVVNGTYQTGDALNPTTNTVDITVNVTTAGPYNISTIATNGMVFTASGTFPTAPAAVSITLSGNGTPITAETSMIPTPGNTPCTFNVVVVTAATVDWKFTEGTTTFQGTTIASLLTTVLPPFLNFAYTGLDIPNNQFGFNLIDASGAINAGETYSTLLTPSNSAAFTFAYASGGDNLSTDATRNLIFTVQSHNTATKTIVCTFSGQVKNNAGTTKTITNGMVTAVYP